MLSLRYRILLTLLPLFVLMAMVGGYGAVLLYNLGGRIDRILRENYDSVLYMEHLKESLERMDSSFQFALAGRETEARRQFDENWDLYSQHLRDEQGNITVPGEGELVSRLATLGEDYRKRGEEFFAESGVDHRQTDYFGDEHRPGLLVTFKQMKELSGGIMRLNQENMEEASRDARQAADSSLLWFTICLSLVAVLGVLLARRTIGTILRPIQSVTESVLAIGSGNLDQVVPAVSTDELGRLVGAVNTMARQLRDYRQSQQARLLRLQQAAQATIDSFPDPVLVVDRDGLVELANPAARRILGLAPEVHGSSPAVWHPPEPMREPLLRALQSEQAYLPEGFDEAVTLTVLNEQRSFLPRILPIKDSYGTTLGAAVLLADVTRFQLLDQVKSDLVATVSHELKTPLTSISMAIHLLLEEAVGPLAPKQTELLIEARSASQRLLAMINNLLDLARLERGASHLQIQPERPGTTLQAAADLVRRRAEDQGIQLEVIAPADLPQVAIDIRVLNHALRNLLDNALTYTGRGGRITLTAARDGNFVAIVVSDTGTGIPSEYLPHVFDRFFRVPDQSRGGGTGLGLAIVREIVLAHGGAVTCTSTPRVGTTFRLTLPIWRQPSTMTSPADGQVSVV
jgi:two-component system, NtrC family, sensor histidine kinase KinB